MIKKFVSSVLMVGLIAINFGSLFMAPRVATAATVTALSDTVSNLTASAPANHTIAFTTPTGLASGATLILTFDNNTSIDSALTFADIDFRYSSTDVTLAAAPNLAVIGVARTSATVITFTNGTTVIPINTPIIIKIGTHTSVGGVGTKQITNGTAGGSTTVLRISGTFGDVGTVSMAIVSNGIVTLNAEVLSALSFTISDNTIYFGTLRSSGSSCWAQPNEPTPYGTLCPTVTEQEAFSMSAGTNATTGYTISLLGDTLTSGGNSIAAMTTRGNAAIGSEQFGIRANQSGGSGALTADYGTASQYALTSTASIPVTFATASIPSAVTTYSVRYIANIAALTEAGSYTTAHTYIATGNF